MARKDAVIEKTFFITKYWITGNLQNVVIMSIVYFFEPIYLWKAVLLGAVAVLTFLLFTKGFGKHIDGLALLASKRINESKRLRGIVARYM